MVLRNVAELVTTPKGKEGRPSKAMTLEQATAMLEHATASRLYAYVVVSLLTGIRTEEARALRWSHVVAWVDDDAAWIPVTESGFDRERFAIYVWRSVRASGDTKTEKSRRTLELPAQAAEALREHRAQQARERLAAGPPAGAACRYHDLSAGVAGGRGSLRPPRLWWRNRANLRRRAAAGGDGVSEERPAARAFSGRTAWARGLQTPLRVFLRTETGSAAVLLATAVAALAWINASVSSYEAVWGCGCRSGWPGRGCR
jgi:integrase